MNQKPSIFDNFANNFMASLVVFLVALPLCMGIAIASGVPPALGLITGIVGGLVVGVLAGSPLQVSGPAAGLAVIVYEIVKDPQGGLAVLGLSVLLAGLIQLAAGALKLGQWFRAVSPAVIQGMLAGIGVLIFASQFHVMVDDKIPGGGLTNLFTIPRAIYKGVIPSDATSHHLAAMIGLVTLVALVGWNLLRPKKLGFLPAPLIAVTLGTAVAFFADLPIEYVSVPPSFAEVIRLPSLDSLGLLAQGRIWGLGLSIALVASAETLLCASAVDQIHSGPRTDYDKELIAQGVGNIICGAVGALPMTGVIVRSSANVEAGGTTRLSAILHGAWLLAFVALLPFVLEMIPVASLAAILVYTGYKLMNPAAVRKLWRVSRGEVLVYATTLVCIVSINLLYGVLIGIALAAGRLLLKFAHVNIWLEHDAQAQRSDMHIEGAATFVLLPRLARSLEEVPKGHELHVHLDKMTYIDHACMDLLVNWEKARNEDRDILFIEWNEVMARYRKGPRLPHAPRATDEHPSTDDKDYRELLSSSH